MASSIIRPVVNRAAHLRITPRPSNLSESRQIYQLVAQFGEVEYYKNLRYDTLSAPQTALVIFKKEEAAANFLRKSPIRVRMGETKLEETIDTSQNQAGPNSQIDSKRAHLEGPFGAENEAQASIGSLPVLTPRSMDIPSQSKPELPLQSRTFQIQTNPTRIHFRDHINIGHYHGSFALGSGNPVRHHLLSCVPIAGLSSINWRAEVKPWTVIQREKEAEHKGQNRRKSLRELYAEGPEGFNSFRDESLPSG